MRVGVWIGIPYFTAPVRDTGASDFDRLLQLAVDDDGPARNGAWFRNVTTINGKQNSSAA